MGHRKRAEMLIQQRATEVMQRLDRAQFAYVRFGNVLGSRGSVVLIFSAPNRGRKICRDYAQGEDSYASCQLVLLAATLALTGDVYMPEMGNPVKLSNSQKKLLKCPD
jgi:FlaA1/EpsC-like NDP-sugar epimerase